MPDTVSLSARRARTVLHQDRSTGPAWAVFDAGWYAARHDVAPEAALASYLDLGQTLGHAPNNLFDEAWHRAAHPGVAEAIAAGRFDSAFDAYCHEGFNGRSPHWLFHEVFYRARYPDLTETVLRRGGFANGYDHYLRVGDRSGRSGHVLFDPAVYLSGLDPDERHVASALGPFQHFLQCLAADRNEIRTSLYFDPAYYRVSYPELVRWDGSGGVFQAIRHYLTTGEPTRFDPLPEFSEAYYLERNLDAATAVERGEFRNGYAHFLAVGARERRAPHPAFDLAWYAQQDRVAADLAAGVAADPFTHYLAIGRDLGLRRAPPSEPRATPAQARDLLRIRADNLLPTIGKTRLDFTCAGKPDVTVIVVLRDRFALTMGTLASLRGTYGGAINLVLIDIGSTDETRLLETFIRGAKILRLGAGLDVTRARNAALPFATTDAVLFLGNAVELAHGAVAAALNRLRDDSRAGAVGGKILRASGALWEAGGIVWRDGSSSGYMRDASPTQPEVNFARPVDYCSAVFLMLRTPLVVQLQGFEAPLAPLGVQDVDLGIRIAAAGQAVIYDPAVVVTLIEEPPDPDAAAAAAALTAHHTAWMRFRYIRNSQVQVFARTARQSGKRILFIEDTVPIRLIGSGFVRSNDIVHTMARLGYEVTVFPNTGCPYDLARVYADMPGTVEVMHDHRFDMLGDFITRRAGYYDAVWIARTHNLNGVRPILERTIVGSGRPPAIILDTEAISALRDAARATLQGEPPGDVDAAIRQELVNADLVQNINVVSELEAERLRRLGFPDVAVVGHMRALDPTPRAFQRRNGLLFVGAIHQQDSPNYDSLCWFIDEVLPLVEDALGWETRLTVAGYTTPQVDLERYRHHARVDLRGAVADLRPLYDQHRIFVAPTRYAGGTPYKVYEAASFGLPVVATSLLREQMGWTDEQELLSADRQDAKGFAARIIALYRDAALWTRLRDGALARLGQENSAEAYDKAVAAVLDGCLGRGGRV